MIKVKFEFCFIALIIFVIFAYASDALAGEFSNNDFCQQSKEIAEKANAEGSIWVDSETRQDGIAVMCSLKVMEFKKFLKAEPSVLREGWQERKQSQWSNIYCQSGSAFRSAIDNGWSINLLLTFSNGEQHRITAKCK